MPGCLSQRDRIWGIRTTAVRNQLVPLKRVPASSALGNEDSEGAQQRSRIVGMRARCFPCFGGSITDSLSPIAADGGAVMEPACASGSGGGGQYSTHPKRN